jgi:hypothetical protein
MAFVKVIFLGCSFLLFYVNHVYSRQLEVSGLVVDAVSHQPLPFCTVSIEYTKKGTITNTEGKFTILLNSPERYLIISYVGYITQKVEPAEGDRLKVILLQPETKRLEEVVIVPKETIADFLKEAYSRINENYTQRPYQLEAFYREDLKNGKGEYDYFGEAQLQIQASGYQFEKEFGRVKILKARVKRFRHLVSKTLYYGGPFIGCSFDKVKRHVHFLKGDEINYQYKLDRIETLNGNEVWVIEFRNMTKPVYGKLFIEKESKAYVRIELKDSIESAELGSRRVATETTVIYKPIANKWYLKFIHYQVIRQPEKAKEEETFSAHLNVTNIKTDSLEWIPLNEQFNYGQPFSMANQDMTNTFWNGTTITSPDSTLLSQLKHSDLKQDSVDKQELSKARRFNAKVILSKIVTRFAFSRGIQFLPYSLAGDALTLKYPHQNGVLNFTSLKYPVIPLVITSGYSFNLNRRVLLNYSTARSFVDNYNLKSFLVGLKYSIQLPIRGRQTLVQPSLSYGQITFGRAFPRIEKGTVIRFGEAQYQVDKMRFYVGSMTELVQLGLSIQRRVTGLSWIYFSTAYQQKIATSQYIFLRDESKIFRKFYTLATSKTDAVVRNLKSDDLKSVTFEVGLRLQF